MKICSFIKKSCAKNITPYIILMLIAYFSFLILSLSTQAMGKKVGKGGHIAFEDSYICVRIISANRIVNLHYQITA